MTDNIKLSVTLPTNPSKIYKAWLNKDEHSAFTKSKTNIESFVPAHYSLSNYLAVTKTKLHDVARAPDIETLLNTFDLPIDPIT